MSTLPRNSTEYVVALQSLLDGHYRAVAFFESSTTARSVARRIRDLGYTVQILRERGDTQTRIQIED